MRKTNNRWMEASTDMGKIPPQDIKIEQAVLGALLGFKDAVYKVRSVLTTPDIFYKEAHQRIYNAICKVADSGGEVDLLIVTQQLRMSGELELVDGAGYVTQLTIIAASDDHVLRHAEILKFLWAKREQITIGYKMVHQAFDDTTSPDTIFAETYKRMGDVQGTIAVTKQREFKDIVTTSLKRIDAAKTKPVDTQFISTGIPALNSAIIGFKSPSPRLIIVGGAPGMGKSTMLMQFAKDNGMRGIPVGVISLEMEAEQWTDKMIVSQLDGVYTNFELEVGRFDNRDWPLIERSGVDLMSLPVQLYDPPTIDLYEVRLLCIEWVAKYGIRGIAIDFLQLIRISGVDDTRTRISQIAYGLKAIAKEVKIPIIAASSMARINGSDPTPKLSHLKESGDIEFAADMVVFPFRPAYYMPEETREQRELKEQAKFDIRYLIAKNRGGPVFNVENSYFDAATNRYSTTRFEEYVPKPLPTIKPSNDIDF